LLFNINQLYEYVSDFLSCATICYSVLVAFGRR
jgi:hypothetical protein